MFVVCFLLGNSPTLNFICRRFGTPKRQHIKFRRQRITQKETYRTGRKFEIKNSLNFLVDGRLVVVGVKSPETGPVYAL
jgi:hypothetical protein